MSKISDIFQSLAQKAEAEGKKLEDALEPLLLEFLQFLMVVYNAAKPAITADILNALKNGIPVIISAFEGNPLNEGAALVVAIKYVETEAPLLASDIVKFLAQAMVTTAKNVTPALGVVLASPVASVTSTTTITATQTQTSAAPIAAPDAGLVS